MNRLKAYSMLAEDALTKLWYAAQDEDGHGCCPLCCSSCIALKYLDDEGILDALLANWDEYEDGTKRNLDDDEMYKDGKLDRTWVYQAWHNGMTKGCYHDEEEIHRSFNANASYARIVAGSTGRN